MKKQLLLLIVFTFNSLKSMKTDFSDIGTPLINHYGAPYLDNLFTYEHNPISLINIIPKNLLQGIIKQIDPSAKSDDEKILKEILSKSIESNRINLKFYSMIWGPELEGEGKWPDRKLNLIYHNILAKWIQNSAGFPQRSFDYRFQANLLMGVFDPNGVVESLTKDIDPNSIPFNRFEPRNVNYHDMAYSPNNAYLFLAPGRDIATFWSAVISPAREDVTIFIPPSQANPPGRTDQIIPRDRIIVPEKKNIIVIFNTLTINPEITYNIKELTLTKNPKIILNGINSIAQTLKKAHPEDASSLNKTIEIVNIKGYNPNLTRLFDIKFLNEIIRSKNKLFIDISNSDPSKHIYQIPVLSQDDPTMTCKIYPVIGNTCGRHSYKNGIFIKLLLDAYKSNDVDQFVNYAKGITNQNGTFFIQSIDQLTKQAICIFQTINKFLKDFRSQIGLAQAETLDVEEAQFIINKVQEITKSCSLPELNSDLFTVISNLDIVSNPEALTIEQSIEFLTQIAIAQNNPDYFHNFIVGAGRRPGEHWINITVYKNNGILNYIAMDSKNKNVLNFAQKLKNILEDTNINTLFDNIITSLNSAFLALNNKKHLTLKKSQIKFFIKDLSEFLMDSIKVDQLLKFLADKGIRIKTEFKLEHNRKFVENILNESLALKDMPDKKRTEELFHQFNKDQDFEKFKKSISSLESKDEKFKESSSSSIFGVGGYKDKIEQFHSLINQAQKETNKSEVNQKLKKANEISESIYLQARKDLKNNSPLRAYLAQHNWFNPEKIYETNSDTLEKEFDKIFAKKKLTLIEKMQNEPKIKISIFSVDGYKDKIEQLNTLIDQIQKESNKSEANKKLDKANEILVSIYSHAKQDLKTNIPLRAYLAHHNWFNTEKIYETNPEMLENELDEAFTKKVLKLVGLIEN